VVDLLVGTTNPGKFAEVQEFLESLAIRVISLPSLEDRPTIVENGATYEENALKKARILAQFSGFLTLADDSGLEVDALGGAPGIYSARFSGKDESDLRNNQKLLDKLIGVPEARRTARFVCVLALCAPKSEGAKEWIIREECEGRIALAPKGTNGFGYDPLFFYPPFGKTFAEIDRQTKATVSHRGKALKRLVAMLPSLVARETIS
jgi:XTP/dITP diphosphohydrolase